MWLLNTETIKLEFFHSEAYAPAYGILSHTWEDEEVVFHEIGTPEARNKKGYQKILNTCTRAKWWSYRYVWIDTCCIDKKSSAELSEAINSMFNYYSKASVCYVYLCDVGLAQINELGVKFYKEWSPEISAQFRSARWFTRGWTLQELLAPEHLMFYDREWMHLGTLNRSVALNRDMLPRRRGEDFASLLAVITGIDRTVLQSPGSRDRLAKLSVAQRMSWAAHRSTTREEDRAYSLLGIFDVNMPLLYGEGPKAFHRLQEEIIRQSASLDHSILAWTPWKEESAYIAAYGTANNERCRRVDRNRSYDDVPWGQPYPSLLSPSPYGFRYSGGIVNWDVPHGEEFYLVQRGLRVNTEVTFLEDVAGCVNQCRVGLNCRHTDCGELSMLIRLTPQIHHEFRRRKYDYFSKLLVCERLCEEAAKIADCVFIPLPACFGIVEQKELLLSSKPFERPVAEKVQLFVPDSNLMLGPMTSPVYASGPFKQIPEELDGSNATLYRDGGFLVYLPYDDHSARRPAVVILVRVLNEFDDAPGSVLYVSIYDVELQSSMVCDEKVHRSYGWPMREGCMLCEPHICRDGSRQHAWRNLTPGKTEKVTVPAARTRTVKSGEEWEETDTLSLAIQTQYVKVGDEVAWWLKLTERP